MYLDAYGVICLVALEVHRGFRGALMPSVNEQFTNVHYGFSLASGGSVKNVSRETWHTLWSPEEQGDLEHDRRHNVPAQTLCVNALRPSEGHLPHDTPISRRIRATGEQRDRDETAGL
jgi:hypothetical protein